METTQRSNENTRRIKRRTSWYWLTLGFSIAAAAIALIIPENVFPEAYLRYVFGVPMLIFLPGYGFLRALFPQKMTKEVTKSGLDLFERLVLSIGMSFALVPGLGLLLDFSPWGINLTSTVLALFVFTIAVSTVAIVRESRRTAQKKTETLDGA
jgi:uncharacterized membrane protein